MKLTEALRKYAKAHLEVAAEASDDDIKAAIQKALGKGSLSADKFAELAKDSTDDDVTHGIADEIATKTANAVAGQLSPLLNELGTGLKALGDGMGNLAKAVNPEGSSDDSDDSSEDHDGEDKSADIFESEAAKAFQKNLLDRIQGGDGSSASGPTTKQIVKMISDAPDDSDKVSVRVKGVIERFDNTKTALTFKKGSLVGQPIRHRGREMNKSTELMFALTGAWLKFRVDPTALSPFECDLIQYALHRMKFYADLDTDKINPAPRLLTASEREVVWNGAFQKGVSLNRTPDLFTKAINTKAVIDDSTSGGQEAIPEFFDETAALLPVLGGEIAPFCNIIDVGRGTSAEAFTMANPSFTSNAVDATAVSLFSTTSFIGNLATTFYRAAGFIEVGLNFLADAVAGIGQDIQNSYGRKAAEYLDRVVAAGTGTSEPQGITVASGTVDITPGNPTTGAVLLQDLVDMMFGVTKAFRNHHDRSKMIYGMTDTRYQSFRSLATGVTGDTRLIFGMGSLEEYEFFQKHVGIEDSGLSNGLTNADAFFAQAGGYRLYRRQGLRIVTATGGDTLTRRNTMLIGADLRFGGQLERGGFAAVVDSFPTT